MPNQGQTFELILPERRRRREKKFKNLDKKGAKVVLGGEKHPVGDLHYRPTILTDLNSEMVAFKVYKTIKSYCGLSSQK
jgi:hypothetical protein